MLERKQDDQKMQSFRQPERTWKPLFKVVHCSLSKAEELLNHRLHLSAARTPALAVNGSAVSPFSACVRFLSPRSMPVENMFLWGSAWNTTPATVRRDRACSFKDAEDAFCLSVCLSAPCIFSSFTYNKSHKGVHFCRFVYLLTCMWICPQLSEKCLLDTSMFWKILSVIVLQTGDHRAFGFSSLLQFHWSLLGRASKTRPS